MKTAFVLGGTGFVGRHVARRLADSGCDVTIGSRGETAIPSDVCGIKHVALDRGDDAQLKGALGDGVDVLVDVIPFEIRDAAQIVSLDALVGSVVAISTGSVYADDQGRTIDEATSEATFPDIPIPTRETQRRAAPGDATYSTKKVAIEDILLEQAEFPATVIRPCAIYGPGDTQCREWFFIKRILDKRPFVLLADEGETVFHTTSVHNLAELVRLAAENPVHGAFNCGDPDPPNTRRIARSIATVMEHDWEEVLLPRSLSTTWEFRNPWGGFRPLIAAMDKAHDELGYEPVTTYDKAIVETVEWVIAATRDTDWREVLPKAADYLGDKFDYDAEDALIRERG
jgi:nucleoside-diphosphate-sugar epimerase